MRSIAVTSLNSLNARFDNLLSSRFALQTRTNRVTVPGRLPPRVESCVKRLMPGCEWRAYRSGAGIFFAIARAAGNDDRRRTAAGLDVYFLDSNAAVYAAVRWEHDATHGWWLDSVLDPAYDCDDGWWLNALTEPRGLPDVRGAAAIPRRSVEFGTIRVGRSES